jgi:hypothetical protein
LLLLFIGRTFTSAVAFSWTLLIVGFNKFFDTNPNPSFSVSLDLTIKSKEPNALSTKSLYYLFQWRSLDLKSTYRLSLLSDYYFYHSIHWRTLGQRLIIDQMHQWIFLFCEINLEYRFSVNFISVQFLITV